MSAAAAAAAAAAASLLTLLLLLLICLLLPDMAEDELTPEQLTAIAAENEEPEPVNYKPPAQKTLKEIQELDKEDESLQKYKKALLGARDSETGVCVCVCVCVYGAVALFYIYIYIYIHIYIYI